MVDEGDSGDLGKKAVWGMKWATVSALSQVLCRLATVAVVSRLLVADEIGLAAAAMVPIPLLVYLTEFGLVHALVQKKDLGEEQVRSCLTLFVGIGIFSIVAVPLVVVPLTVWVFEQESIRELLVVGSWGLLLRSAGLSSFAAARRELRFEMISMVQFFAAIVSICVVVASAVMGLGAVSIMLGFVATSFVEMVGFQLVRPVKPLVLISPRALAPLFQYGRMQVLAASVNFLALQLDNIFIGRTLGMHALGIYSRAFQLSAFPARLFESSANMVLLPLVSRVQDDCRRTASALLKGLAACGVFLFPLSGVVFVLAPEIVAVLLGPGWNEAIFPFRVLTFSIFVRTANKMFTMVLRSLAEMRLFVAIQLIYAVAICVGLMIAVPYGLTAATLAVVASLLVVFVVSCSVVCRLLQLPEMEIGRACLPPLLLALAVVASSVIAAENIRVVGSPWLTLIGTTLLAISLQWALIVRCQKMVTGLNGLWICEVLTLRSSVLNKIRSDSGSATIR